MLKKFNKPVRHYDEGDFVVGSIASENDPVGRGDINAGGSGDFLGEGVRSGIDSWDKAYTDAGGKLPSGFNLSDLKQFVTDNKGWITAAGAIGSAFGGGSNADKKTGYQGGIPALSASRSMIAAPPTRAQGYRPGAGGIDYGGDVTYALAPGASPWSNLSGTSGSSGGANTSSSAPKVENIPTNISNIITGGTKVIDTGGTKTTTTGLTAAEQKAVDNWKKSLTPQQYLSQINQWIADRPNLTKAELDAAMSKFQVSQTDLQTALGASKMSAADKYALTHGQGLADINQNIVKWIQDNPYATKKQIDDAIKGSGVDLSNIDRALTDKNASKGLESALMQGMGLDQYYTNINKFVENQKRDTTTTADKKAADRAAAKASVGVSDEDIAAAEKFLTTGAGKAALEAAYTPALPKDISGMKEADIFKLYDSERDKGFSDSELRQAADKTYGKISDTDWNYIKSQAGYAGGGEISMANTNQNLANLGLSSEPVSPSLPPENISFDPMDFAEGGMAKGRYLQGQTDGMADELPAQIGQDQPAALSHGEFVIPADVVSHMGNGNSDAGAKKLYQMMDKIRMARTGTKKQGKKINPDKFMPGGLAQAYANGGSVKHFVEGGKTVPAGTTGIESNLSNWAGQYVTNMLGQGQALANMPYQAYKGQLTAGESPLQTGAFNAAAALKTPESIAKAATQAGNISTVAQGLKYNPNTSSFDSTQLTNYMNPYLDKILDPQLAAARRQSQITQQQNAAKMTQAGAFGGGRQAILDAETQRALADTQANITGQGYNTAFSNAMAQFNADQQRKMAENQYGAGYGLQGLQTGLQAAQAQGALGSQESQIGLANLAQQLAAGAQQRGIESEGIAADKAQFEEARANPYKMVQFQQSLLQGLPLSAQNYQGISPSALTQAAQGATTVNQLLKNLGLI
jgi:hypothetical protein